MESPGSQQCFIHLQTSQKCKIQTMATERRMRRHRLTGVRQHIVFRNGFTWNTHGKYMQLQIARAFLACICTLPCRSPILRSLRSLPCDSDGSLLCTEDNCSNNGMEDIMTDHDRSRQHQLNQLDQYRLISWISNKILINNIVNMIEYRHNIVIISS